jgi:glycosyltransferase involved in cell wall biosynthesis
MVNILYPINLDRWKFPVATSLREVALRNSQFNFYSFSSPSSEEDKILGQEILWSKPHIHHISQASLLQKQFDIVHHASATTRNLAAALLAKARSFGRCVHIFTAPIQPHTDDDFYRQYVLSVRFADVLAAVSHAVAKDIEVQFGRKVDAVIPSGVDLHFFSSESAEPIDMEKWAICSPYVLFVGVLTQRKRPDFFMEIAALMPDIDFVMVGEAYTPEQHTQYLAQAKQYSNVKCLGRLPRADVRNLMASATALVFPSELEGLPLTILESLSVGTPVLAQPRSAMPEAVIDDLTGWLLTDDVVEAWVSKLREILNWSSAERDQFSQQARQFVAQHYSWDLVASQYAELYARLM